MERIWLNSYPSSVPSEINPDIYPSLFALIKESCDKFATHPAFENYGVQLTYQALYKKSTHLAAYFQKKLQLVKGDRVAIMLPNILQYPIVLLACLQLGLIVVNINPQYTPRELLLLLTDSGAKTIVVLANFLKTLQSIFPQTALEHIVVTELGDEFPYLKRVLINCYLKYIKKAVPIFKKSTMINYHAAIKEGEKYNIDEVSITLSDLAFLQYTGGTTGVPKGAMLTHRNMVANLLQSLAWIDNVLEKGKETVVAALPLYHIFSLTICCFAFLKLGGLSLLITDPRQINTFIKILRKTPFSVFIGVNTLYQALLQHDDFHLIDFSTLKLALAGGMSVKQSVANRWAAETKKPIIMGYGLTEASPVVTINPLTATVFTGSIGLPVPSTDVRIVNNEGHDVPLGKPGELCVLGPQNMLGYWHQPSETAAIFLKDQWLKTGDICFMDEEGYLYLVDRKKDMILVSGFNVYPNEVEEVIASHPSVQEVAVIGVPNEQSYEMVKALIVTSDASLTEEEIRGYCKKNLTGYKQPKIIEFVQDLPKSNVGKVLKRKLRP